MDTMRDMNLQSSAHQPFDLAAVSAGWPAETLIEELLAATGQADGGVRGVVIASPGTGKTTVVSPTLADRIFAACRGGKGIVAQPSRMAAREAARSPAHMTGTRLSGC